MYYLEITFFILSLVYVCIINRLGRYWHFRGWRVFLAPLHGAFGISVVITALWMAGDITGDQWLKIWRVFQMAFIPFVWLVFKRERAETHFDDISKALDSLARAVDDNIRRVIVWKH
jgi:hypothetical protein